MHREINIDEEVATSQADTDFRKATLANLMKSFGSLNNDVQQVLDVYFNQCAIRMSCM